MTTPLMTPEQVAEHFGVPLRTIYRWSQIGYGPTPRRVGRHLRYRPEDVETFVDEAAKAS